MGGYLTYAGKLDRARLEMLLKKLADMEQTVLEERAAVGARSPACLPACSCCCKTQLLGWHLSSASHVLMPGCAAARAACLRVKASCECASCTQTPRRPVLTCCPCPHLPQDAEFMEGKRAKRDARAQQGFSSMATRAQAGGSSSSSTQPGGMADLLQALEEPGAEEGEGLPAGLLACLLYGWSLAAVLCTAVLFACSIFGGRIASSWRMRLMATVWAVVMLLGGPGLYCCCCCCWSGNCC